MARKRGRRVWKGTLTKNLTNYGDAEKGNKYTLKAGEKVKVTKSKTYCNEPLEPVYEFWYTNGKGGLVRMPYNNGELFLKEFQNKD